jgi:hypothetical protein
MFVSDKLAPPTWRGSLCAATTKSTTTGAEEFEGSNEWARPIVRFGLTGLAAALKCLVIEASASQQLVTPIRARRRELTP